MKANAITLDIPQLEGADAARLRQLWTDTKGSAPPKTFTARLMRLALAWEAQAARDGSEPAKTKRVWTRIIRERSDPRVRNGAGGCVATPIADGSRILKDWGGTTHEVLVTDSGATWNGQIYTSLSALARAMTGTNRNGPKFFGLREGGKQ
jgi:hypothetical protein